MTLPRREVASTRCPWSHELIRAARKVELAPLLRKRGLGLQERRDGNWEVMEFHGLLLKASYWRWPERNLSGNTIDFFTLVLGTSFHNAMKEITHQS
jgi:hypothetical protein